MIELKKLSTRKELRQFVLFAIDLYRENSFYVPPLINSEIDTFDATVNPAYDFCEAVFYMAYKDGRPVGRIAGIINHKLNEQQRVLQCRFGWVDFIDDYEVSRALLDTICEWGRNKGMNILVGPLGFTDLDYEGCLIKGHDKLATIATIYNYPYYREHFEHYGMHQDALWNEYLMQLPKAVPDKHLRVANMVKQRFGLKVVRPSNRWRLVKKYGRSIFDLLNKCYAPLYGFCPLSKKQIDYYISVYLPFIRLDCIRLIVDQADNVVCFGITCPSLSKAQQKAHGNLFPFGWWHMFKAMYLRGTDVWDLYLVGVHPDYQGKGVNALLFTELIPQAIANGYHWAESNPELATNNKVQEQWAYFNPTCHKQRCSFIKEI